MKRYIALWTLLLLPLCALPAQADSFLIGGLGFWNGPGWGFKYSLLHQGTATSAMAGQYLAWLELDPTWTGSSLDAAGTTNDGLAFYRDSDGRIEFRANLYDGLADPFTVPIGQVVVKGSGFTPARLDGVGHDLKVMGFLTFEFDLLAGDLATWIGGTNAVKVLSYVDKDYGVATQEGTVVNGKTASQIALWGARGDSIHVNAEGGLHWDEQDWTSFATSPFFLTDGHQLGSDLAIDLGGAISDCTTDPACNPVPELPAISMLLVGLVGACWLGRRYPAAA